MPRAQGRSLRIEFRPILPRDKYFPQSKWNQFEHEAENYLDHKLGPDMLKTFEKTVKNWSHKPQMTKRIYYRYGGKNLVLHVFPYGRYLLLWKRISTGVRRHNIYPNGPWLLKFREHYTPHTRPGGRWGGPGLRSGGWVTRTMTKWKGIKSRHFAKEIKKKYEKRVHNDLENIAHRVFK